MIVAVLTVELYLPGSISLKDKRAILRQLKDRLANKFNISIAEVDHLDKWQRAQLGIAQVGSDYKFLEKSMNTILQVIDENGTVEVTEHLIEYL